MSTFRTNTAVALPRWQLDGHRPILRHPEGRTAEIIPFPLVARCPPEMPAARRRVARQLLATLRWLGPAATFLLLWLARLPA